MILHYRGYKESTANQYANAYLRWFTEKSPEASLRKIAIEKEGKMKQSDFKNAGELIDVEGIIDIYKNPVDDILRLNEEYETKDTAKIFKQYDKYQNYGKDSIMVVAYGYLRWSLRKKKIKLTKKIPRTFKSKRVKIDNDISMEKENEKKQQFIEQIQMERELLK
jgi:hypothetical protein